MSTGFPLLDQYTEGLQPGLILVGGQSNSGKTAFLSQIAWQMATHPKNNAYVLFFSLDDMAFDVLPRIVACDQQIPINAVKIPKKYKDDPEITRKREMGIKRLIDHVKHFKIYDQVNGQSDIKFIEETIKRHLVELEAAGDNRRMAVFIDNFYDIDAIDVPETRTSNNAKYEYIAEELDRIAQVYQIPVVCSAEFRKLNGNKRPTLDDIRETVKVVYKSKLILLVYNEVGLKGENASVYFTTEDTVNKQPVLEVHFAKNKFTSFKQRLFYHFYPAYSYLEEVTAGNLRRYQALMG
ncbi:DnaB-like helicase C-terminal domain-containing protein [Neomoorella thermoacetica]|nr:DnaB-like helicase C-terminal domain-containing protein [Moorella thermoacetica]